MYFLEFANNKIKSEVAGETAGFYHTSEELHASSSRAIPSLWPPWLKFLTSMREDKVTVTPKKEKEKKKKKNSTIKSLKSLIENQEILPGRSFCS